jgi:P-aminobenzoate N-oxygenase AurF
MELQNLTNDKGVRSQSLEKLNFLSEKSDWSVDDVDWSRPIDYTKNWMPHGLINIRFLPSYEKMTLPQKRRYNQLYALAIAEQFIWFEEGIVIPILQKIVNQNKLSPDLLKCLEFFMEDETKHSRLFRKLICQVNPEAKNGYRFYNLSHFQKKFYQTIVGYPDFFSAWIWMTIYFEERTIHISKLYHQELSQGMDETFVKCHRLHMIDEARHVQIDQYLLRFFYDQKPIWNRKLAAWMYRQVVKAYASPKRISGYILNEMKTEFPESVSTFDQIINEFELLPKHKEFIQKMFGPEALGRTRKLLDSYPEMRPILEIIT